MGDEGASGRDPLVGAVLGGKYRVEVLLARGGMGRVYRGVQEPLGRPVAIKVLDFHALDVERNEQIEKRFFLEASVCARLTHPNTLTIHDYGTIDGARGVYIVMEFLEGKSLRDLLKEVQALPVPRALHVAQQICGALIEAHEAGLVHRDLKPGNVVLVPRGNDPDFVKVVDFGLVKQVASRDDSAEILTAEGLFLGTPRYMAPEQITGEDVDARTDIYALGVMLYECLTGQPPFRSKIRGDVPVDLFNAHMKKRPPAFETIERARGVPAEVEAIVMRCLAKSPHRRFASMRELLAALERADDNLDELPTREQPIGAAESLSALVAETLLDEAPHDQTTAATKELLPQQLEPAPRAGLWLAASAGIVVLLGASVIAGLYFFERLAPDDPRAGVVVTPAPVPSVAPQSAPAVEEDTREPVVVRVRSTPPGAEVHRAGVVIGTTPMTLSLDPKAVLGPADRTLIFTREGYEPTSRELVLPPKGDLEVDVALEASPKKPAQTTRAKRSKRKTPEPDLDIKVDR